MTNWKEEFEECDYIKRDLLDENDKLKEQIKKLQAEINDLHDTVDYYEQENRGLQDKIDELKRRIQELEDELQHKKCEIDDLEKENRELQRKVSDLESELSYARRRC